MRSAAGHARPESTTVDASRFYDAADTAAQYTKAGAATQSELTQRCLALLGPLPRCAVLGDLGSGSGLSGAVLSEAGITWLGLDVSRRMLNLAIQHEPSARGAVALADLGGGLPLRAGCLDGAVSVSALQWLCVASSGDAARARCAAFFAALRRALRPGAAAVLQVYCADDAEAELLLSGACGAGFPLPLLCVDFPHATAAKKLFLCVRRQPEGDAEREARAPESSSPACALAWPRRACCAAAWWQRTACTGYGRAAQQRLGNEHTRYARRLVRLMRRGAALREASGVDDADMAARALAAAFPKGSRRASWCCLRPVVGVSAPPPHSAAAAVVADALRSAAWEVEVRAAPLEATPQHARFTGHKRDRAHGGSAASSANNARKNELRAAAGAPPDAAFVALAHGSCGGVHVGLLLSPDAAPHGAATALLRGDVRGAAMRAAAAFEHAAGVPVLALDVALSDALGDAGEAKLLLLAAGPIDLQAAAAAAKALSELALS